MKNILLIGNGAREHAIAVAVVKSKYSPRLFSFMKASNPGIARLSADICLGSYADADSIVKFAQTNKVNFAIIGPEDPLSNGIVDMLASAGIPAVGPTKLLSRLETSKSFTRDLVRKYNISGNPQYKTFTSINGVAEFMETLDGIVIKPDGLTGGKRVMVQGDHFDDKQTALNICKEFLKEHDSITVEEKFEGEEFSLQCISDGKTVVATPAVQDHKRRLKDDKGANTGGMGSYSCADHLLPFISAKDIQDGLAITQQVADAIYKETGCCYKGIMYGGFMVTKNGVKLLEYNARFGDPEAMNILPLLKTDFVDLCLAVINGTLAGTPIEFEQKATVCKYVVPKGYGLPSEHPDNVYKSKKLTIGDVGKAELFYASVDQKDDGIYMSSSRAIGVVGIAVTLQEAEQIAQDGVKAIVGEVAYRKDIGTQALIEKRIAHMRLIKGVM